MRWEERSGITIIGENVDLSIKIGRMINISRLEQPEYLLLIYRLYLNCRGLRLACNLVLLYGSGANDATPGCVNGQSLVFASR